MAFAESMQSVWYVMLGVSILGLLSTGLMREVAMMNTLDATWGLQDEKEKEDVEAATVTPDAIELDARS